MESQEQKRMSVRTTAEPVCRHAITGLAPRIKMCAYNHECARCPLDQMLTDLVPLETLQSETGAPAAKAA
jgi:hypothetical protein